MYHSRKVEDCAPYEIARLAALKPIIKKVAGSVPAIERVEGKCSRCGGDGIWKGSWHPGTCYGCAGSGRSGKLEVVGHSALSPEFIAAAQAHLDRYHAKNDAKVEADRIERERKQAEKDAEIEARRAGFLADNPVIEQASALGDELPQYARNILASAVESASASDRMIQALVDAVARVEADRVRGPLEEGRREVSGVVVAEKETSGYMGRSEIKLVIKLDDGNVVYGSSLIAGVGAPRERGQHPCYDAPGEPRSCVGVVVGDRIRFVASIERSDSDEHFGFYKRPVKAELIERGEIGRGLDGDI